MPSTIEQLNPTRVKLTIEMPFAELKPHLDKSYKSIAEQVNIPGFRKGKVPPQVIDRRFGRGVVLQEAINEALPAAYATAIEEHKVSPLGQPEIDVTRLEDGDVVEFTAEVDVRPEFDLPDVSTITAKAETPEVNEDAVEERIQMLRERFATTTEVDRPAKDGDVVTLDLNATKDGEQVDDATASGVTYKLGSGGMLEGLDEAVTGLSAGESKTFSSELVGGAHRGEKVDIEVQVTKVAEQELPEVDDEFAQMVSQFDTAEQMRADLAEAVQRQARLEQAASARDKVLEAILEKTDFDLPETLVKENVENRKLQITQQLAQAGMTVQDYLDESEDESAKDADEFWAEIEKRSLDALKAQIILDKVAEDGDFQVSQEELTQLIFAKASQSGQSPEQEMQHMMQHNHMGEWMQEIRRNKALEQLVAQATITDADGAPLPKVNPDGTLAEDDEAKKEPEAAADKPAKKTPAKKPAAKTADAKKADEAEASDEKAKKPAAKKAPAKKPAAKKADKAE